MRPHRARAVHFSERGVDACCRGVVEFMAEPYIRSWHPRVVWGGLAGLQSVTCTPLGAILDRLGIVHVNLFVLDVIGSELKALQSLDFSRVSFDVIVIELDGSDGGKDAGVVELLSRNGYDRVEHVARNDWFVRRGFRPQSSPLELA